jgi:hypothetical protein
LVPPSFNYKFIHSSTYSFIQQTVQLSYVADTEQERLFCAVIEFGGGELATNR